MEGEFSLLEVLGDRRLRLQALVYTPESLESRDLMDGGVSIQEEPISSLTFSLENCSNQEQTNLKSELFTYLV